MPTFLGWTKNNSSLLISPSEVQNLNHVQKTPKNKNKTSNMKSLSHEMSLPNYSYTESLHPTRLGLVRPIPKGTYSPRNNDLFSEYLMTPVIVAAVLRNLMLVF